MATGPTYSRELLLLARTAALRLAENEPTSTSTEQRLRIMPVERKRPSEVTTLSLESSMPPPSESSPPPTWEAVLPQQAVPMSPSAQVSLCASLPPMTPPSLPMTPMTAWQPTFWPGSPAHFSPMCSPHGYMSVMPPSLPPVLPPSTPTALPPTPLAEAPPSWNAWSGDAQTEKPGTTACSRSESASTMALDEKAASETESTTDSAQEVSSRCETPLAKGRSDNTAPSQSVDKLPVRALCLDGLI